MKINLFFNLSHDLNRNILSFCGWKELGRCTALCKISSLDVIQSVAELKLIQMKDFYDFMLPIVASPQHSLSSRFVFYPFSQISLFKISLEMLFLRSYLFNDLANQMKDDPLDYEQIPSDVQNQLMNRWKRISFFDRFEPGKAINTYSKIVTIENVEKESLVNHQRLDESVVYSLLNELVENYDFEKCFYFFLYLMGRNCFYCYVYLNFAIYISENFMQERRGLFLHLLDNLLSYIEQPIEIDSFLTVPRYVREGMDSVFDFQENCLSIAELYMKLQDLEKALQMVRLLGSLIDIRKSFSLADIAKAYARIDRTKSLEILDEAYQISKNYDDTAYKLEILCYLAYTSHQIGLGEKKEAYLQEALFFFDEKKKNLDSEEASHQLSLQELENQKKELENAFIYIPAFYVAVDDLDNARKILEINPSISLDEIIFIVKEENIFSNHEQHDDP